MTDALRPGAVLDGRFTLVRRLGVGSTGAVWLADDPEGTSVACKILHPQLADDRVAVNQMMREARVLTQLNHPNITRPIEFSTEGRFVFLAMELVVGRPLHEVIGDQARSSYPFSQAQLYELFGPLCEGVAHAHSKFIVHRDLKPQNVMVATEGERREIKILDFGLARLLEGSIFEATTFGRALGSLFYMSPEQTAGKPATIRSDVFALGAILFELVTLHRAWARDAQDQHIRAFVEPVPGAANSLTTVFERIARGPRPSIREIRPELPDALDRLIQSALAINAEERPTDVDELWQTARACIDIIDDGQPPTVPDPRVRAPLTTPQAGDTIPYERAMSGAFDHPTQTQTPPPEVEVLDLKSPSLVASATEAETTTYEFEAMPNATTDAQPRPDSAPTHSPGFLPNHRAQIGRGLSAPQMTTTVAAAATEPGELHNAPLAHGVEVADQAGQNGPTPDTKPGEWPATSKLRPRPTAAAPSRRTPGFWPRRPAVERNAPPPTLQERPPASPPMASVPQQRYPTAEYPTAMAFPQPAVWIAAIVVAGLIGGAIGFFVIGPRPKPETGVVEVVADPDATAELTRLLLRLEEDPMDMDAQQKLRQVILRLSSEMPPGPERDQLERLTTLSNSAGYLDSLRVAAQLILQKSEPM